MSLIAIADHATLNLNGPLWTAQSAGKPYSLQVDSSNAANQMVFEAKCGENCAECGDTSRRVRSELYSPTRLPQGIKLRGVFSWKRSGVLYPIEWDSIVQVHCQDSNTGSPAFQLGAMQQPNGTENVVLSLAYQRWTDTAIQYVTILGPAFTRNATHNIDFSYVAGYGGNGYVSMMFDGTVIATYDGPLGYAQASPNTDYLKVGIHAGVDTDGQFPASFDQTDTVTGWNVGLAV